MFSRIKNKLSGSEKAGGLEIVISTDGSVSFNFCIAERKKNEIKPVFIKSEIKTIGELKELIPSDIPVAASISGKGVVLKKLTREAFRKFTGFAELIPDVKESEIVGDRIITDDQVYLTIIRKSLILQYLELFDKQQIPVISVHSGPSFFGSIVKALNTSTVSTDVYEFQLHNNNLSNISPVRNKNSQKISIGDLQFDSNILISFSAALSLIINSGSETDFPEIQYRAEEWKEKKVFRKIATGSVILLSVLLFLNLFLFFYWSDVNKNLAAQNKYELIKVKDLEYLEIKYKEKEAFVKKAGWLQHSRMSLFMDEIASTVPASVSLTELTINPFDEDESRLQKKILFSVGKIIVCGTCKDPVVLNPWIKTIKSFVWINTVTNRKYQYDAKNQIGRFEIELIVKNEF